MIILVVIGCVIIFTVGLYVVPIKPNVSTCSRITGFIAIFITFGILSWGMLWRYILHTPHAPWWSYLVASLLGSIGGCLMELFSEPVASKSESSSGEC